MVDTSDYTIEYRILAATWYHECDKGVTAVKTMKRQLRDRFDSDPPDTRVIKIWEEKLFRTGSILDLSRSGRPNERGDHADEVTTSVRDDPQLSIRRRSDELQVKPGTLYNILKKDLGYKNWRPTKVQFLSDEDRLNRVQCCQQILDKYDNNVRRNKLFFSDECAVYAEGRGSNIRLSFWSKENPHFYEQVRQHPPSVMVWAAMSAKHLIGPFFLDGSVTSEQYIRMLQTQFIPALEEKGILLSSHFQQDGAPAHTALATRNYLMQTFQDRWVGKFGPTPWPARSPDLTSCDNALWGILKPKIMSHKAHNVAQLRDAIIAEFNRFPEELLPSINKRTFRRLHLCIEEKGYQVDPYDK